MEKKNEQTVLKADLEKLRKEIELLKNSLNKLILEIKSNAPTSTMSSMLMKILKHIFVFVVLFQLSCTTTDSTFLVRRIIDGDTIVVYRNSRLFKIRLAEIDCPEKRQSFGLKAKQFLSKLILNRKVEIKIKTKDRYGRIIGTVFFQNRNINYLLVQQGLAWHYKKYSRNKFLSQLEEKARINKKGLWSQKNPVPPWVFRKNKSF